MSIFKRVQKILLIITIILTISSIANAQWMFGPSLWAMPYQMYDPWMSSYQMYDPWMSSYPMYDPWMSSYQMSTPWMSSYPMYDPWMSSYQTSAPWMSSYPMYDPWMSSYQTSTPWMSSYPMTSPLALSTQSNYNLAPWSVYPTYISTPSEDSSEDEDSCPPGVPAQYGKPAIYLYPEEDTYITVNLNIINGELTKSDPDYQGGWNVFVTKDGTIYDENGLEYDYLFWEGTVENHDLLLLPNTGWVIAQKNLEAWFSVYLNALGLVEREIAEFTEYWVARLQDSPYYEIKLVDPEVLNNLANLTITTSDGSYPDTMIRILFHFRGLDEYEYIEAPVILTPEREGFVVVEWGGIYD